MTDLESTEPLPLQTKPFTTAGYLFLTTLWATVLPGLVITALVCFAACFVLWGIPFFALCLYLFYLAYKFHIRFLHNLHTGNVPDNFTLRILPFFLPLFYTLLLTAAAFYFAPLSEEVFNYFMIFGLPHYFVYVMCVLLVIAIGGGIQELVPLLPCGFACLVAIAGTIYVSKKSTLIPQRKALTLMFGITFVLCWTIVLTYWHFRTEILYDFGYFDYGNTNVVHEERRRERWEGDDTNLSEYQPFAVGNKLVKIESPTLSIDSDYPKLHGALALYPVCAAAVEAIYRNIDKEQFDNRWGNAIVKGGTSPNAFNSLLEREKDMAFMLQPSEKQLHEAEEKGIKLTITPFGYEAFVFFVS
jgi:hypothetical protein